MDIGKTKDNYDKDRKLRYFNYNIYEQIVKIIRSWGKKKKLGSVINMTK